MRYKNHLLLVCHLQQNARNHIINYSDIIHNTNKCSRCNYNFGAFNHEKIKEDLWNTFPTYLTQWSTFIRLKNLNDKLGIL